MNIRKVIEARTIRNFDKSRTISDENWADLLTVAQQAVSSQGREWWRIIEVESSEIRAAIEPFAPGMWRQLQTAPKFIFFVARRISELDEGLERLGAGLGFQSLADFDAWAARQVYLPLGQMIVAAGQLGIDSCPMEGCELAKVSELLGLDGHAEQLVVACAFGYRAKEPEKVKRRRAISEIVTKI